MRHHEHPASGVPTHDLTGGNAWIPWILASTVSSSPNHDPVNQALLTQGPAVLTLDLTAGMALSPTALLAAADRAVANLQRAPTIENLAYSPSSGA